MLNFLKSSLCILLTVVMLIGCASNAPAVHRGATNPKQTEASKEKESFGKMILPGVIAGLGLCVVLTFVSLATSSNTDN